MCKTPHASTAKLPSRIPDNMIEIPGGAFAMGSNRKDANENERPVHPITVKTFHLDRTEVTVEAYAQCVRAGACSEPDAYNNQRGNYRIFCNWKHPQNRFLAPDQLRRFFPGGWVLRLGRQTSADRGRMGICGPRRIRRPDLPLGERQAGPEQAECLRK